MEMTQIIKASGEGLKFELNTSALKQLLEPVKDQDIAIISVVGATDHEKLSLLNSIGKQFSVYNTVNESVKSNDQITKGGVWLSTPKIIRQISGKDLGLIILDSNSGFEKSTIQNNIMNWISVLLSACLIFNLHSNLSDDVLETLEPFLQYLDENSENSGKTIFVIQNWSKPGEFNYGLEGGKRFLANRIEIKSSKDKSVISKRLLNKRLDSFECYLMPVIKNQNNYYRIQLLTYLKGLMVENKLTSMIIENMNVKGSNLVHIFSEFVEILNNETHPKTIEIKMATKKAFDCIFIDKLNNDHLNSLNDFISKDIDNSPSTSRLTNRFNSSGTYKTRQDLLNFHEQFTNEILRKFEENKKTEFKDIIDELQDQLKAMLKSNYSLVVQQNENKRNEHIAKVIKQCNDLHDKRIGDMFRGEMFNVQRFYTKPVFDDICKRLRIDIKNDFKSRLAKEEMPSILEEFKKLEQQLKANEDRLRAINNDRLKEATEKNEQAVIESIEFYRNKMLDLIESKECDTNDKYYNSQYQIHLNSRKLFVQKCEHGDQTFTSDFDQKIRQKLTPIKYEFNRLFKQKLERLLIDEEIDSFKLIDQFSSMVKDLYKKNCTVESFKTNALLLKEQTTRMFKTKYGGKDLHNTFNKQLDINLTEEIDLYELSLKRFLDLAKNNSCSKAVQLYDEGMAKLFIEGQFYSDYKLQRFNRRFASKAVNEMDKLLKSVRSYGIINDDEDRRYITLLKEQINVKFQTYLDKNNKNRTNSSANDFEITDSDESIFDYFMKKFKENFDNIYNQFVVRGVIERREGLLLKY